MEQRYSTSISVRNLVEFVMRAGDIDSGFVSSTRAVEGTKGHQKVQSRGGEGYTPEVAISHVYHGDKMDIEIIGRIDGIIEEDGRFTIDEIKTTRWDLNLLEEDYNPRHWAQARCYAYIYSLQKGLEEITVRLTYYNIDTEESRHFEQRMAFGELEVFFNGLMSQYESWAESIISWQGKRNQSIKEMSFPFEEYRRGQKELAVAVYKTIIKEGRLFAQAPTGTGKTMGVMFPAVKALGEGLTSKIFYLTAKTITRTVAENSIGLMRGKGLHLRSIILTAKEKICFNKESACNPRECEYAMGHFDRINTALTDMMAEESITRDVIESYSKKHRVCPFEFSLDAALFSDVIICDYNYLFDPRASLKRFFSEGKSDFLFLVDEAHNLVDRAREMFSAQLQKGSFMDMKAAFKGVSKELYGIFTDINKYFIDINKEIKGKEYLKLGEKPKELYKLVKKFTGTAEELLSKNHEGEEWKQLLDLYFEGLSFERVFELYGDNYTTFIEGVDRELKLKLLCLDPSSLLQDITGTGRSTIFFSATLSPMKYYADILGGGETPYRIKLDSPFPPENLCVMLDNSISTRYINREGSYDRVTDDIGSIINKRGNYLIFFPSYKYLFEVYNRFIDRNPDTAVIVQKPDMSEEEREEFLSNFDLYSDRTLVGFAVMGGLFGEGIDLTGDKLIGAVIVGVGLPQVSPERNIIKDYFDSTRGNGFEYAYIYPGINRVMQAAGRVIRTESDRGVVLLIDDRFSRLPYRDILPEEWSPIKRVSGHEGIENLAKEFWEEA